MFLHTLYVYVHVNVLAYLCIYAVCVHVCNLIYMHALTFVRMRVYKYVGDIVVWLVW